MNATDHKQQLLTLFPAFRSMSEAAADEVMQVSPVKTAPAGTVLFTPGTPCRMFPLVLDGVVRVSRVGPKGRELPLYRVHAGESCILTASALLGDSNYPATGVVETELTAVAISNELFARLVTEFPEFRAFVFKLFAERVMDLMQLLEEVAFRKLDERLAALLVLRGSPVRATHQQLADELGSVREMVSRLLRSFEERGWVRLRREQIELRDAAALQELAGQA